MNFSEAPTAREIDASINDAGDAFVVWRAGLSISGNLYVVHRPAGETDFGGLTTLTPGSLARNREFGVAVGPTGGALAAWTYTLDKDDKVSARIWTGSAWTDPHYFLELDTTTTSRFRGAAWGEGTGPLVLMRSDSTIDDAQFLHVARWDGSAWSTAQRLDDDAGYDDEGDLAARGDYAAAVWHGSGDTEGFLWVARYDGTTNSWASAELVDTGDAGAGCISEPLVDVNAEGDVAVAYYDCNDYVPWFVAYDASEGAWEGPMAVGASPGELSYGDVALADDGRITLVYQHYNESADAYLPIVYARAPGADVWTSEGPTLTTDFQSQGHHDLACDAQGNVMFTSPTDHGVETDRLSSWRRPAGEGWGSEQLHQASDLGWGGVDFPALSVAAGGRAMVAWVHDSMPAEVNISVFE